MRALVAVTLCALLPGCFPDYGFASDDAGPGAADSPGSGSGDAAGDGAGGDATTGGDGGRDGAGPGADGAAPHDGGVLFDARPWDGATPTGMVVVPGSTFYFPVLSDGGFIDAQATLDYNVAIDKYEATVARFDAWLDAGMPAPCGGGTCSLDPGGPYDSVMTWDPSWNSNLTKNDYTSGGSCGASAKPNAILTHGQNGAYPINCVNWVQAQAVCAYEGKRLPTETEWRFFATGQGTAFPYPWGTAAPDCPHALGDLTGNLCGFPLVVGSAYEGVSTNGVFDLVGSLSEWEWDLVTIYPSYSYPAHAGVDYVGPTGAVANGPQSRDWIGSDFSQTAGPQYFQSTWEGANNSSAWSGYDNTGFRCAKSL